MRQPASWLSRQSASSSARSKRSMPRVSAWRYGTLSAAVAPLRPPSARNFTVSTRSIGDWCNSGSGIGVGTPSTRRNGITLTRAGRRPPASIARYTASSCGFTPQQADMVMPSDS